MRSRLKGVGRIVGRIARCLLVMGLALPNARAVPPPNRDRPAATDRSGRAGDVLSSEPFAGAPDEATAGRIVYASTALDGAPISVSGLVVVPPGPAPAGGRPVLAWLHPTTEVARDCAPTAGPAAVAQIQGLSAFLATGYAVVATDYPGLGEPGAHPYLAGVSEARAALDSVRSVRRLPQAQASGRFAVWGHSQGAHAALFTGELARDYAPELHLVGVAAAAPATDLAAMIEQPNRDPLWGALLSYTVWSWSRVFRTDPDAIVPAAALPTIERVARNCLETAADLQRLLADAAPLQGQAVTPSPQWRALLAENAPTPRLGGPPVFLAQGRTIRSSRPPWPATTPAASACSTAVRYFAMPGVDHYTAAMRSAGAAASWIAARFAEVRPPDDCAALR